MPTNILMPALSPTMEEGNLAKWHVKAGDPVRPGDVIAEIETDKATMEVEAVDEGRVGSIVVPEGAQGVKVNAVIAVLLGEGESLDGTATAAPKPSAGAVAPVATAKAVPVAPLPARNGAAKAAAAPPPGRSAPAPAGGSSPEAGRVVASPLARRLAKEGGIDLAAVHGSGPHGRIVKADIDASRANGARPPVSSAVPGPPAMVEAAGTAQRATMPALPSDQQILRLYEPDSFTTVPHDGVRKIIARRLTESKQTIPHFYLTMDTEIDALLALRAEINAAAPKARDGTPAYKISVNDLIIKALAMALQAVPDANATWTEGGMLLHRHSDVAVAVAIPGGLITPVVRRAELKRISEISNEMKDLASRGRERRLKPEEYQGGSTSVSNLGMYGVRDFAAVINPPHSSILAVGAGEQRPVVRDGKLAVATLMTVTLSTDHRAVDGALGAQLLGAFRTLVEKPAAMLA